jgi:hypothetical protein
MIQFPINTKSNDSFFLSEAVGEIQRLLNSSISGWDLKSLNILFIFVRRSEKNSMQFNKIRFAETNLVLHKIAISNSHIL